MRELLAEFRDTGGDAIEVLSSSHAAQYTKVRAIRARVFGMLASSGSDSMDPASWADLATCLHCTGGVTPVWKDW